MCLERGGDNDCGPHWCDSWCSDHLVHAILSWGTLAVFGGPAYPAEPLRVLRASGRRPGGGRQGNDLRCSVRRRRTCFSRLLASASRQLWSVCCGWSTVCTTWCMVGSSQTLAFPVGTPSGVLWLMLSSARIFCGYRGAFPMQIFARRKSKRGGGSLTGPRRVDSIFHTASIAFGTFFIHHGVASLNYPAFSGPATLYVFSMTPVGVAVVLTSSKARAGVPSRRKRFPVPSRTG